MKALVKETPAPGLCLRDVPEPAIGPDEVLIRVQRAGVCGTDLHIRDFDPWAATAVHPPLIIGHEFAGEVAAVGPDVEGIQPGDRVSGEGHLVCGHCRNCMAGRRHLCRNTVGLGVGRDGAFAQYVALPAENVWVHRIPVDLDVAAIFDPFGNAVHTALSFPVFGEDVLITGAGPIGLMAAAVVKHAGSRRVVITDVSDYRLELAEKLGVDLAVNVRRTTVETASETLGLLEGFDVGLEMSGQASALRSMIDNMIPGGHIAALGLPASEVSLDLARVVTSMITIKGIYGREMFETWHNMSVLIEAGLDLSPVITGKYHYTDYEAAFDAAASGDCGKIILDWTD